MGLASSNFLFLWIPCLWTGDGQVTETTTSPASAGNAVDPSSCLSLTASLPRDVKPVLRRTTCHPLAKPCEISCSWTGMALLLSRWSLPRYTINACTAVSSITVFSIADINLADFAIANIYVDDISTAGFAFVIVSSIAYFAVPTSTPPTSPPPTSTLPTSPLLAPPLHPSTPALPPWSCF
jgi:hypothetical protein